MDATSAAFLTEFSHELSFQLNTSFLMHELALADLDDEDDAFSEWKEEARFVLEQLCYTKRSIFGAERVWFFDETFRDLLEDEANWEILSRVMHFFNEHDIRVE